MPSSTDFPGLTAGERQSLLDWSAAASERGLDAVADLAGRPWNVAGTNAIIGVFRRGERRAAWLLVQEDAGWSVLDCAGETIIGGTMTLEEGLALIVA